MPANKVIILFGNCMVDKCKKRSTNATRISDFWVERCEAHKDVSITLDKDNIKKVGRYIHPHNVYQLANNLPLE